MSSFCKVERASQVLEENNTDVSETELSQVIAKKTKGYRENM